MDFSNERVQRLIGLAVYGLHASALGGLLVAVLSVFNGEWTAAAIGFLAMGLSYGLLVHALLRR